MENNKITPFDSIIADNAEKINDKKVTSYSELAKSKIDEELKNFNGDRYAGVVKNEVASRIKEFCDQDEEFARVVYKFKRTLSECCNFATSDHKSGMSDVEVYKRAIQFYFPNTEVTMLINIKRTGEAPDESEILKEPEKPKAKPKKTENQKSNVAQKKSTVKIPEKPKNKTKKQQWDEIQLSLF